MPEANPVEEIRQNVACDKCGYNLRGLRGATVTCPECGWQCDMVTLVTRRWTKPWWKAPRFNALVVPTAWLVVSGWISLIALAAAALRNWGAGVKAAAGLVAAAGIVGWVVLLVRVSKWWPGRRGPVLSLLTFVVLAGYLLAIQGGILILFYVLAVAYNVRQFIRQGGNDINAYLSITFIAAVVVFALLMAAYGARRLERWIAAQCISRYLAGPDEK